VGGSIVGKKKVGVEEVEIDCEHASTSSSSSSNSKRRLKFQCSEFDPHDL
jgi:hypothetical protein